MPRLVEALLARIADSLGVELADGDAAVGENAQMAAQGDAFRVRLRRGLVSETRQKPAQVIALADSQDRIMNRSLWGRKNCSANWTMRSGNEPFEVTCTTAGRDA
jgi:hypothetical protein